MAKVSTPGDTFGENGGKEEAEADYMSMAIADPISSHKIETLTQRRLRKQREAEARAHPKSKEELALEAEKFRQKALETAISTESKGARMMAKLGYKPGNTLGAATNSDARLEPIGLEMKEGREGIGALSEKKRKFREDVERAEAGEKKRKEDEGEYRERVARERDEKRCEGMWWGAMKVMEGLDNPNAQEATDKTEQVSEAGRPEQNSKNAKKVTGRKAPLSYRPLKLDREEKEAEKRRRYDLSQSLSRNATYDDPDEDARDRQALGQEVEDIDGYDEVDEELQAYLLLSFKDRLQKVVNELRETWAYCFWCKYQYGDRDEMDRDCPGESEDEHG